MTFNKLLSMSSYNHCAPDHYGLYFYHEPIKIIKDYNFTLSLTLYHISTNTLVNNKHISVPVWFVIYWYISTIIHNIFCVVYCVCNNTFKIFVRILLIYINYVTFIEHIFKCKKLKIIFFFIRYYLLCLHMNLHTISINFITFCCFSVNICNEFKK